MVDLPDIDNREQILRVLLRKETLEPDFDFREVCSISPAFARRCAELARLAVSHLVEGRRDRTRPPAHFIAPLLNPYDIHEQRLGAPVFDHGSIGMNP
jgi:hypothetical protein